MSEMGAADYQNYLGQTRPGQMLDTADPATLNAIIASPHSSPLDRMRALRALHTMQAPSIGQASERGAPTGAPIAPSAPMTPPPQMNAPSPAAADAGADQAPQHPLDAGAARALKAFQPIKDEFKPLSPKPDIDTNLKDSGGSLAGMNPSFLDAVKRATAASSDDEADSNDKGLALAQAGFSMAASNSPYFGQALGQGGMMGLQALQQMRQQRAVNSMKNATLTLDAQKLDAEQKDREAARGLTQQQIDETKVRDANEVQRYKDQNAQLIAFHNQEAKWHQDEIDAKNASLAGSKPPSRQPGQSDDDYRAALQEFDPGFASMVDGVANYQMQIPGTRNGKPNPIATAAFALNPDLDAKQFKARNDVVTDFAKGKAADAQQALSRVVGHIGALNEDINTLGNYGGAGTMLNAPANAIATLTGSDKVTNFNTDARAVASELRKVFAGTNGGSLSELESWEKSLSPNMSPAQQVGAMNHLLRLLDSQSNALADKWNKVMPNKKTAADLFDPEARQALATINPEKYGSYVKGAAPAAATAFKSPDEVKAAVSAGSLSMDDAHKILKSQFGFDD